MNKVRRKEIINIIEQLYEVETKVEDSCVAIREKNYEEEAHRYNMPVNMWWGDKFTMSEEASGDMKCAYEILEELSDSIMKVIDYLEDAVA